VKLLFALTLIFTLCSATSAYAIARNTVLTRAQTWIDRRVPYSQTHYYGGYRTDCSGYASMCWALGTSKSTRSFYPLTHTISKNDLKPGDALLGYNYHIRIFYGWLDDTHTTYVCYEQTGPTSKSSIKSIGDLYRDKKTGKMVLYAPTRLDRIVDSPAPRNMLRNGSINVWARPWQDWSHTLDEPVWWQFTGSRETTLTMRRMDVSKSARNSVQLFNGSADPATFTEMSQEVSVTPETTYTLSAWARTANDPAGVEMQLEFLDAIGAVISSRHASGDAWHVDGASFNEMVANTVSPPGSVRAVVTMRLAGGATSVSETETVPGTSVLVDEISFVRPKASVAIRASVGHSHVGRSVILSGAVTPSASLGAKAVVYVKKPGSSTWVRWHDHQVYKPSGSTIWKCSYTFKKGMRKGTYSFKTVVLAFAAYPGWLGSTSPTVYVKLQ
jgi:hypothetical protein